MGEPKALLCSRSETLLERAVSVAMEASGRTPLISLPHPSRCDPALRRLARRLAPRGVVHDAEPDCGPAAGVLAALEHPRWREEWLLWIAVDMPRLDAATLRHFATHRPLAAMAAVAAYRSRVQPTCALLHRSALPLARRAAAQRRGLIWLLEAAAAAIVPLPRRDGGSPLLSIDTPATWRTHRRSESRPAPAARS